MVLTKAAQKERLHRNEEKWSPTLMEAGWTALPSIILEKQQALGLDAIDVNILLQLARHWWYADNPPYPSKATIAQCLGVSTSTVRRHIAGMEAACFIRREARYDKRFGGQESNIYHFDGLIDAVTPFAKEAIDLRNQQKQAQAKRRSRKKRPTLVLRKSGAGELK